MGKVLPHMTMSLDGYIADPSDQPGERFDWYQAGEVSVPSANETVRFDVDPSVSSLFTCQRDATRCDPRSYATCPCAAPASG